MHQQAAGLARFFGEHADGGAVDRGRQLLLLLGLVDRGVGGCVDDDIRFGVADDIRQTLGPRQVALVVIERGHLA